MEQHQEIYRYIGNILIVWAAVVAAASVVAHARVPWWRSEMGRHLMAYMGVMAIVLGLSCVRIVFNDTWWFSLLRLVTFIGVPLVMSQRLWLQIKAQRDNRPAPREDEPRSTPPRSDG